MMKLVAQGSHASSAHSRMTEVVTHPPDRMDAASLARCVNAAFEDAVILVMLEPADKDCAHVGERNPCSALQPRGFEHPPCLCVVAVNGADHGVRDLPGRGRTAEIRRMQR